jgi:hypothetical protein
MAHTIALSDEDYAALASASAHSSESIVELLHEAIAAFCAPPQPSATYQDPTGNRFLRMSRTRWDLWRTKSAQKNPGSPIRSSKTAGLVDAHLFYGWRHTRRRRLYGRLP